MKIVAGHNFLISREFFLLFFFRLIYQVPTFAPQPGDCRLKISARNGYSGIRRPVSHWHATDFVSTEKTF